MYRKCVLVLGEDFLACLVGSAAAKVIPVDLPAPDNTQSACFRSPRSSPMVLDEIVFMAVGTIPHRGPQAPTAFSSILVLLDEISRFRVCV